ncbi:hypothetical protein GGS20DRAFT_62269 [Poronia punctata]|nr:hypothetical protein GGS20DRAFT_62269 [Poronia punctata]
MAEQLAGQLRRVFDTSPIWRYEKLLGTGCYGLAALLTMREPSGHYSPKHVVLKRMLDRQAWEDIFNEMDYTKKFRGDSHMVQLLAYCEEVSQYRNPEFAHFNPTRIRSIFDIATSLFPSPQDHIFDTLGVLGGPALLLEYLPNGSLDRMYKKMNEQDPPVVLPNRLLWRFLLCLLRACVALAYPSDGPRGARPMLEDPADRARTALLGGPVLHNDLHMGNIMLGDVNPAVIEDALTPQLKIIDMGLATQAQDVNESLEKNVYAVLEAIILLINPEADGQYCNWNGIVTGASDILPFSADMDMFPHLDPDFVNLMALSMAHDYAQRPSIANMVREAHRGVMKTARQFPGREAEESDAAIERLLGRLLFDA